MKKRIYKAPVMELVRVQLEHGFMKASILEPEEAAQGVSIDGHEVGDVDDYATIEGDNQWD